MKAVVVNSACGCECAVHTANDGVGKCGLFSVCICEGAERV